eukprot:TRINITY_DN3698_c0_g1_i5.p2 TRINITY_DN3698_c0_g1~~TRINITY_DN3698_c0_g1_i5.p2  ORF type:complete len:353 (-),score=103.11 TRINITY_DN3698_c0_g1_i5:77-1135(-)
MEDMGLDNDDLDYLEVRKWLAGKGLEQLTPVFVAKEYTDVAVMGSMGLDNDDLDYLEITNQAHRDILTGKVQASRPPAPAPARSTPSATPEEQGVRQWLAGKGLEQLAPAFIEKEYTDVAVMEDMGLDNDDLDYLEITNKSHRDILGTTPGRSNTSQLPSAAPGNVATVAAMVNQPQPPRVDPKEQSVRKWLADKGLEQLTPIFMTKEYTDVAVMGSMGLDTDDLDYLGITNQAHRDILTGRVQAVRAPKTPRAPSPAPASQQESQAERDEFARKEALAAAMLADDSDGDEEPTEVGRWLKGLGLERYTNSFLEKEYNDVGVMLEMGLDDNDLDFLEITDLQARSVLKKVNK